MSSKTRRIIAREVLIFFGAILVTGIFWILFWSFSAINEQRRLGLISQYNEQKSHIDSIRSQVEYYVYTKTPPIKIVSFDDLGVPIRRPHPKIEAIDSTPVYASAPSFMTEKMSELGKKISAAYFLVYSNLEITYTAIILSLALLIIIYPVRGLYFLLRWSIVTIRQPITKQQEA